MVHRPADSRLLSNLLSQEKEYAKHLSTFLDHSNASLASFTAYASASAPSSAHLILAVAGSLAAADEALRHYAAAVDRWRDYLKGLKALEDEVANIMRDREILVTRLIKASKPAIHASHSASSLPLSPSQSSFSASSTSKLAATSNTKLAAAQSELQACELHLAQKERALDAHRTALVREGLAARCRALAECGRLWADAGSAGETQAQSHSTSEQSQSQPHTPTLARSPSNPNKPLPKPSPARGSDLSHSSIAPSQSASQINLVLTEPQLATHMYSDAPLPPPSSQSHGSAGTGGGMDLLAAHPLTADLALPLLQPHVLARRITEEDLLHAPYGEDGEESSAAEDGPLQVVENPRFTQTNANIRSTAGKTRGSVLRREGNATYGGSSLSVPGPSRSGSGFFGSLRGLFGRKAGSDVGTGSAWPRRWGKARGGEGAEADSDEGGDAPSVPPTLRARVVSDVGSRRLRRGDSVKGGDGARKAEEWVGGQGMFAQQRADPETDKGWVSDSASPSGATPPHVKRRKSKKGTVRSVASSAASDSTADALVLSPRQKRRASLGVTGSAAAAAAVALAPSPPPPLPGAKMTTRAERRASMPVHPAPREPDQRTSLMSIVEGVARANRNGWAQGGAGSASGSVNSNGGLMEAKAPRLDAPMLPRGRTMSAGATPIDGLPRAPGSVFATMMGSTPAVPSTFSGPEMTSGSAVSSQKRPAKSPLRSALRTASPPPPVPATPAVPVHAPAPVTVRALPPAAVPVPIPVPAPMLNGTQSGKAPAQDAQDDSDDAASMSSYETGHEAFDDEGDETEHEEHAPAPPPHEFGNGRVLHHSPVENNSLIEDFGYGGSDLSASSASTQTGAAPGAPQRRKSVRVSLQPTFSTTPPAIDDDDDAEGRSFRAPWEDRRPASDMWEDSSEEDVEYQKAKRLLTRVARKEKKNR
ncbi:hypothetical protein B0H10DRAFT_1976355 [Mycena sp. CBHHK59/15]|nr:hypothetical protein B0H10DRAFT_1976355 [Mycena sp. CBHHK59/15]